MQISRKILNEVIRKIVKNSAPEKIIIFGSYAEGKPTADSDLDILIIKNSSLRRDKRALEIYRLFEDRLFALDIIVYTPQEVEICSKMRGSFIKNVINTGKIMYARAA